MSKRWISVLLSTVLAIIGGFSYSEPVVAESNDYEISNPRVDYDTRETIYFGSYWQEDTNEDGKADQQDSKTPIQWQIIKKYDDGTALVVSDKVLDFQKYNQGECSWKSSTIRKWLNDYFYNNAFSESEKKSITKETLENGGEEYNTEDYVFLLNSHDVTNNDYGFPIFNEGDVSRVARPTSYVKFNSTDLVYENCCWWWLRLEGSSKINNDYDFITGVSCQGEVDYSNNRNNPKYINGVRPAIRVDLSSEDISFGENIVIGVNNTEWDTVIFGKYMGNDISWIVLNVEGNDAFLLSEKLLDEKEFDDSGNFKYTWGTSKIRKWLNNDFMDSAFSESEKNAIISSDIESRYYHIDEFDNEVYDVEETADKIFLLSEDEITDTQYGFSNYFNIPSSTHRVYPNTQWLLRTTETYSAKTIDFSLLSSGLKGGIRPAIHLDLTSNAWRKGIDRDSNKMRYIPYGIDINENNMEVRLCIETFNPDFNYCFNYEKESSDNPEDYSLVASTIVENDSSRAYYQSHDAFFEDGRYRVQVKVYDDSKIIGQTQYYYFDFKKPKKSNMTPQELTFVDGHARCERIDSENIYDYYFKLYKDGKDTGYGKMAYWFSYQGQPGVDFSNEIEKLGNDGKYTFKVRALSEYSDEYAHSDYSEMSEINHKEGDKPVPSASPTPTVEVSPTIAPTVTPTSEPTTAPSSDPTQSPTSKPTEVAQPTSQPTVSATPTVTPSPVVAKDKVTTFSIKNKAKVKKTAKIKIKDKDKIKKITLNGKTVKIKKNKTSFTLKLKSYKKKLKKKGKWNTLKVTDKKGNVKSIKFKTK